eukprot:349637-Chlamydomonas_euryale.AAC.6
MSTRCVRAEETHPPAREQEPLARLFVSDGNVVAVPRGRVPGPVVADCDGQQLPKLLIVDREHNCWVAGLACGCWAGMRLLGWHAVAGLACGRWAGMRLLGWHAVAGGFMLGWHAGGKAGGGLISHV